MDGRIVLRSDKNCELKETVLGYRTGSTGQGQRCNGNIQGKGVEKAVGGKEEEGDKVE